MRGCRPGNVVKIVAVTFSLLSPYIASSQINMNWPIQYAINSVPSTPADRDRDGVVDSRDLELNTPRGWAVDAFGVTLDVDKDGVADSIDREKHSPFGAEVDAFGVSVSGVKPAGLTAANASVSRFISDTWPLESTVATYARIPEAGNPAALVGREMVSELEIVLNSVNDLLDGSDMTPIDLPLLADNAAMDKYLQVFGGRRIRSVKKKLLRNYKITVDRLPTTGYGELAGLSPRNGKVNPAAGRSNNDGVVMTAVNALENKKEKKTQVKTIRQ